MTEDFSQTAHQAENVSATGKTRRGMSRSEDSEPHPDGQLASPLIGPENTHPGPDPATTAVNSAAVANIAAGRLI